jgi:hypothetical protein
LKNRSTISSTGKAFPNLEDTKTKGEKSLNRQKVSRCKYIEGGRKKTGKITLAKTQAKYLRDSK